MTRISVILPTYNRINRLRQVLAGLESQTYTKDEFEVIVVSDGSQDGTDTFLEKINTPLQLTAIFQTNRGPAAARNRGIERADGDIILFVDDDVLPAPTLIEEHMRFHEHERDIVVIGPMLTPSQYMMSPWVAWEQEMLYKQYRDMRAGFWQPTARQFYTGNSSVARHHLLTAGGFDSRFRRAEDVELAYRLSDRGLRFVFNPKAIGYHYAERSFESWLAVAYAYGRNDVIFTHQQGRAWLLPTIMVEYQGRHKLVRGLTSLCLDRSFLSKVNTVFLNMVAMIGDRINLPAIPRMAYSGIYNLHIYQGIADELGGRDNFFSEVNCAGQKQYLSHRACMEGK